MKKDNITEIVPEIVVPKGYSIDEIMDMSDDFGDEKPIFAEEVKVRFE